MDRDEILLRSKNDNRRGDELEKRNRENAEVFSKYVICGIILLLTIFDVSGELILFDKTIPISDFFLFLIGLDITIETGTKYYFLRKKRYLFSCIFFSLSIYLFSTHFF